MGGILTAFGVAMLVEAAFAPYATWVSWLLSAMQLAYGAVFLFFGFNARRAARAPHHPPG